MDRLLTMVEGYLREVEGRVRSLAGQGAGREVLGAVPGRPAEEDEEILVDRVCDLLLDDWCRRTGFRIQVCSEHGVRRPYSSTAPPEYLVAVDPFDGSGLFKRRLPAEWWSVLTVYQAGDRSPVCGGAMDILRRVLYVASGEGVRRVSLESGTADAPAPGNAASLRDEPVIAAYLMNPSYLVEWTARARGLLDALVHEHPAVRIWPNGGACVYPWLATGLVHAYMMFGEPRSEIDPGLAFSASAGFPVCAVQADGRLEPYRFDPAASSSRVPFLLAACTEDLAREIVGVILHQERGLFPR